jgi:uncharacterized membrane protein
MPGRRLGMGIGALCVLGLGIAAYLTYVHYAGLHPLCLASGGCERVQMSHYARLAGIPVPVIGLAGYAAILGSLFVPEETGLAATTLLALVGFGFSAYLTGREIFSIHHLCEWCLSSFVLIFVIMCLSAWRFMRGEPLREQTPPQTGVSAAEPAAPVTAARS